MMGWLEAMAESAGEKSPAGAGLFFDRSVAQFAAFVAGFFEPS